MSMNNEERNAIPETIVNHMNNLRNQISILNAEMEELETVGRDYTEEYEILSKMESGLAMLKMELEGKIKRANF